MTAQDVLDDEYAPDRPLRMVVRFFRGNRLRLGIAVVLFIIKSSPVWMLPLVTANVIDVVIRHRRESELWVQAAILLAFLVQNVPMHTMYVRTVSHAIRDVETRLRGDLCRRLQQLSIGFHRRSDPGILQTKVMRDVENVGLGVRDSFDLGLAAITSLTGGIVITAIKAPVLLPLLVLALPTGAALGLGMRRRMRERNTAFRHTIERLSSGVSEMTHLVTLTRAHALEPVALERIDDRLQEVRDAGIAVDTEVGFFGSLSWTVFQLLGGGCLIGSAWVAYHGYLGVTPGDVVLVSSFFVTLTGSVSALMNLVPVMTKGLESVRSLGDVLAAPDLERNEGKPRLAAVRGDFSFEGLTYRYAPDADPALEDFTLRVEAGETIAVVGASGSGKSTLLNIVIGLMSPTSGRVLLDGHDMASIDLRSYRKHLAIVPQEPLLFAGSVRDNVTYGRPELSDDEVHRALAAAHATEFVDKLPEGWETTLGDRGARLSGGQKQRIAIARALIRDPRVLVLDEATSALDTTSEKLVREALGKLMAGRTCFVVAHRLSTVQSADRIVVLSAGRVVEVGPHDALLRAGGPYSRLHASALL
ncbi:MAG: transporter related protein [Frankiales bacterium]|nr:transporter related protein [Frankiales bacterium]